jgi:hypothetical protein
LRYLLDRNKLARSDPGAAGTEAEKIEFVTLDYKSRRSETALIECASGNFEKPVTGPALKMVMVLFAGSFVQGAQFRRVDLLKPTLLNKQFQVPIDGRLIQRPDCLSAGGQNLANLQRPVDFRKDILDCIPLICFPLHESHASPDQGLLQESSQ